MQEVPNWIFKLIELEGLACRQCNHAFTSKNLMSISVQESSQPPHKDFLCIGLYCPSCKELMIFELKEMSLVDFAFDIVDQETSNRIRKKDEKDVPAILNNSKRRRHGNRSKKSKITLKEINDIKSFLKPKDLLHEEFLIAMGMTLSEIEQYNYKKEKKNDK